MRATDIYTFSSEARGIKGASAQIKDALNVSRHAIMRGDDDKSDKELALALLDEIDNLASDLEKL